MVQKKKTTINDLKGKASLIGLDVDALLGEIRQDVTNAIMPEVDSRIAGLNTRIEDMTAEVNGKFDSIREMLQELATKEVKASQSPEQTASNKAELSTVLTEVVKETLDKVISPIIQSLRTEIDNLKKTQVPMTEGLVKKYVEGVRNEVTAQLQQRSAQIEDGQDGNHNGDTTAVAIRRPGLADTLMGILGKLPPETVGKLIDKFLGGGQNSQMLPATDPWRLIKLGQALNPNTDIDKIRDVFSGTQAQPPK